MGTYNRYCTMIPANNSVMVENKMAKAGAAIGAPLSLNALQKKFEFSEKRAFNSRYS